MPRLRILCVALDAPLPADNGNAVRALGVLRALVARHDVTLVAIRRPDMSEADVQQLSDLVEGRLHLSTAPALDRTLARRLRTWRTSLWHRIPPQTLVHSVDQEGADIERLAPAHDAVVFLGNGATTHLERARAAPVVAVDVHNVAGWSSFVKRSDVPGPIHKWFSVLLAARLMRAFERRTFSAATAVVVTSEDERDRMCQLYGIPPVAVIPSAMDHPSQPLRKPDVLTVGWLGTHEYKPNSQGLVRFVEEAWAPMARDGWELLIAGPDPTPEVEALQRRFENVRVLGFVPDLHQDFLAKLGYAVVPLWHGAGVKLKTVAFLGAGIPLVSTTVGLEGSGARDGEHALIRDDPSEIATALRSLAASGDLSRHLAAQGRDLALRTLSWDKTGGEFVQAIESLVGTTSGGQAGHP